MKIDIEKLRKKIALGYSLGGGELTIIATKEFEIILDELESLQKSAAEAKWVQLENEFI